MERNSAGAAEKAFAKRGVWQCLCPILRQRCPRCRTGRMFRDLFEMNDLCPVCGLPFQPAFYTGI
jgi:uncharacterized protein (DUF983 family)